MLALDDLKQLTNRSSLCHLLREAAEYPDSVLTAIGYLLWTVTQESQQTGQPAAEGMDTRLHGGRADWRGRGRNEIERR